MQDDPDPDELSQAIDLAERWRACHAYPINTFQSNLRNKLKSYPESCFAAQRLKRMPTIISKLKLFPTMELGTMQDIGGVRAVMDNVSNVYKLANEFRSCRFTHTLVNQKDYIEYPRSEDGYRGIHLIYKYKNNRAPSYEGLRIELQIRTKKQHTWATAVETMGTFLGQALKSRQGDQEWLDFFTIVASAIAFQEKQPPIPRFNSLSQTETYQAVADAEAQLEALERMSAFSIASRIINDPKSANKKWSYHLIVLNSIEKRIEITPYDRESLQKAIKHYERVEAEAAKGRKIEPVLVSAGPLRTLYKAYPNFFLDINDFQRIVRKIINDTQN